jgi:hypothetical protein
VTTEEKETPREFPAAMHRRGEKEESGREEKEKGKEEDNHGQGREEDTYVTPAEQSTRRIWDCRRSVTRSSPT